MKLGNDVKTICLEKLFPSSNVYFAVLHVLTLESKIFTTDRHTLICEEELNKVLKK